MLLRSKCSCGTIFYCRGGCGISKEGFDNEKNGSKYRENICHCIECTVKHNSSLPTPDWLNEKCPKISYEDGKLEDVAEEI